MIFSQQLHPKDQHFSQSQKMSLSESFQQISYHNFLYYFCPDRTFGWIRKFFWDPDGLLDQNLRMTEVGCFVYRYCNPHRTHRASTTAKIKQLLTTLATWNTINKQTKRSCNDLETTGPVFWKFRQGGCLKVACMKKCNVYVRSAGKKWSAYFISSIGGFNVL